MPRRAVLRSAVLFVALFLAVPAARASGLRVRFHKGTATKALGHIYMSSAGVDAARRLIVVARTDQFSGVWTLRAGALGTFSRKLDAGAVSYDGALQAVSPHTLRNYPNMWVAGPVEVTLDGRRLPDIDPVVFAAWTGQPAPSTAPATSATAASTPKRVLTSARAPKGSLLQLIETPSWDGRFIDPLPDTAESDWIWTSAANAPSPRRGHTVVWTGLCPDPSTAFRYVVWGGMPLDGRAPLSTGGVYDPLTDNWTAISTAGAPSARSHHLAVWTGSEMLVWGGSPDDGDASLSTGALYDPKTDTWRPMTEAGAPAARQLVSGAWTGTELVLWGGVAAAENAVPLMSGGAYSPSQDRWRRFEAPGVPARFRHASDWVDGSLVMAGGSRAVPDPFGGTKETEASGFERFDPAAGFWAPVPFSSDLGRRLVGRSPWRGEGQLELHRSSQAERISGAPAIGWRFLTAVRAAVTTLQQAAPAVRP